MRKKIRLCTACLAGLTFLTVTGCGTNNPNNNTATEGPQQTVTASSQNTTVQPPNAADKSSSSSSLSRILDYDMLNSQVGFLSGYMNGEFYIWKTTDGGVNWKRRGVSGVPSGNASEFIFPRVDFLSKRIGWIAWITPGKKQSTLTVLHTVTGGKKWSKASEKIASILRNTAQIQFVSSTNGWIRAVSYGASEHTETTIYHTLNAGKSWAVVSADTGYIADKQATPHALPETGVGTITFANSKTGWVSIANYISDKVSNPVLYHTTSAGHSWYPVQLPVPKSLQHGYFTITNSPVLYGKTATVVVRYFKSSQGTPSRSVVYHTSDGGKYWAAEDSFSINTQYKDYPVIQNFANQTSGWIISRRGTVFKRTDNGGRSWTEIPVQGAFKTLLSQGDIVDKLNMVTYTSGWMSLRTQKGRLQLLKTTDGGERWVKVSLPALH